MTASYGLPTRPFADSGDSLLRFAMRADLVADRVDLRPGVRRRRHLRVRGAGGVHPGCAAHSASCRIGVVAANIVYTLVAGAVAAAGALPLTTLGVIDTLASAVYTALFGYLQYLGVRRLSA